MPEPDFSSDLDDTNKLSDADQARVDAFLKRGVNSVERKPFKPLVLIFLLMAVVAAFSPVKPGHRPVGRYLRAPNLGRYWGFWYSANLGV